MKKLMLVAALVCAAATSQAVTVKWTGGIVGLDAAGVLDNGNYSVGSTALYNNSAINYVITFYSGTDEICSDSGTMSISALGKGGTTFGNTDALAKSTAYTYTMVLSGTQADLAARGVDGAFDYSGAEIETTLSGSFTTKASGVTQFNDTSVSTWTVSGIVPATDVPEPTSGLLLLLGVAGLALRRRRA